jgi:predicted MFS family arabinose efflux permease
MTTTLPLPTGAAATAQHLITKPLRLVLLADFAGLSSFYLLLSAVPLAAASAGGGELGAGLATAALMLSTVAMELGTPRLTARLGHRAVLGVGLVLLGLPALALVVSSSMLLITVVSLLRGIGLAIIFVVCGELGAALVPAGRRGEGLGVLGVVAGVPALIGMPLSVWLVGTVGFPFVFTAGALVALLGITVLPGLRNLPQPNGPAAGTPPALGVVTALRMPAVLRPSIVFAASAMAAGVVATFLPAAVPAGSGDLAAVALLLHAAAATVSRWLAGRFGDRHGVTALLTPGVLVGATGMGALVLSRHEAAVLIGAVLFGVGFGVVQNASLATLYDQVDRRSYGSVTAVWSVAYDTGLGVGAAGFGLLAPLTSYGAGFAIMAAVMVGALSASWCPGAGRPDSPVGRRIRGIPAVAAASSSHGRDPRRATRLTAATRAGRRARNGCDR